GRAVQTRRRPAAPVASRPAGVLDTATIGQTARVRVAREHVDHATALRGEVHVLPIGADRHTRRSAKARYGPATTVARRPANALNAATGGRPPVGVADKNRDRVAA